MRPVRALVYFSDEGVLDALDALARELGRGRGEAVRVLLDRARGNFQRIRHDVVRELTPALLHAQAMGMDFPTRDEPKMIERGIRSGIAVLANPLTPSGRGGAECVVPPTSRGASTGGVRTSTTAGREGAPGGDHCRRGET